MTLEYDIIVIGSFVSPCLQKMRDLDNTALPGVILLVLLPTYLEPNIYSECYTKYLFGILHEISYI